jgi:hypothetical protein
MAATSAADSQSQEQVKQKPEDLTMQQQLMHEALAGAVDFEAHQQARGIPPLQTAAAGAMLIGLILAEGADDLPQLERAIEHLVEVIRLVATDVLAEKQGVKH